MLEISHIPERFESSFIDEMKDILDIGVDGNKVSEMTDLERKFLNGIIRQVKPKKILEVGVASGGGSSIILNAIKDIDDSRLYSIDYNTKFYRDENKNTGYIVEERFPDLLNKWKLYTGSVASKFMKEIGGDIDLCILDTMHSNPGEFLDFLMVLPYLKNGSIVIIHDLFISSTCLTLFNIIKGKKYTFHDKKEIFNNYGIGAIIIDDDIKSNAFDYFFILNLSWSYMPSDSDIKIILEEFKKHYSKELVDLFIMIANRNKKYFYIKNNYSKEIKYISKISWWIPIKKLREGFRDKKNKEIDDSASKKIEYF